jgi:N-dimethylarginine dimethylaminohydrolase
MVDFGVSSMVAPLREVLVYRPGSAFAAAFDEPAHGYRQPVDLDLADKEHTAFVDLLESLQVNVHLLGDEVSGPDAIYQYDPSLVTRRGAILLRSGKPTRRGEEDVQAEWYQRNGIPIVGRIEVPGTVDGGDVFWLDEETLCVGRTLRTNNAGIEQLTALVDETVHVFDMPYDAGPDECLHLLSVISPVSERLAVAELERMPVGLYRLCVERGVELIPIPKEELATLACNVLAVAPGVVVMLDGNPVTRGRLEGVGVEVHTFSGQEICLNGSGGPTCLTRPIRRGGKGG